MRLHSIRWRLTLSYAAIALLAALALGLILLTTLRSYYQQREKLYLAENAQGFVAKLAEGIKNDVDLQSQVEGLAFVVQARIRLINLNQEVLADSGMPQPTDITFATFTFDQNVSVSPVPNPPPDKFIVIAINKGSTNVTSAVPSSIPLPDLPADMNQHSIPVPDLSADMKKQVLQYSPITIAGPTFGLGLQSSSVDASGDRSDQVINEPLFDSTGLLQGYIELSDGPAYGVDIVNSAARGWALAGAIAIILAALAGWLVSRRLSKPILVLTDVTTQMASGDLAIRADISGHDEIATLARSFNYMAGQVEVTIMTLRRFVADAAHEFHTPLTALRTDLDLAIDSDGPAGQQELLTRAQDQIKRLESLTNGLLDLSRLEANGSQHQFAPLDLTALVEETSEIYASQAEQAGITFSLDLPQESITINGDDGQLRRALGNLLDNALKFTPEDGTVSVALHRTFDENQIELTIQDSGIGIPVDDLPQLFSRFHRGRNAATYPGNGLGLAIVKAIIERHGGRVMAENRQPGACFLIQLPLI